MVKRLKNSSIQFIVIFFCGVYSCTTHKKLSGTKATKLRETGIFWTENITNKILLNLNSNIDSTVIIKENVIVHSIKEYSKSNLICIKNLGSEGQIDSISYFGIDTSFELRRKFCKKDTISYQAIFYKRLSYGIVRWLNCKDLKEQHGLFFAGKKIGLWRTINSDGTFIETDYKMSYLIDSLPEFIQDRFSN